MRCSHQRMCSSSCCQCISAWCSTRRAVPAISLLASYKMSCKCERKTLGLCGNTIPNSASRPRIRCGTRRTRFFKTFTQPVHTQHPLLVDRFNGDKAHLWPASGFTDGSGIIGGGAECKKGRAKTLRRMAASISLTLYIYRKRMNTAVLQARVPFTALTRWSAVA